MSSLGAYLCGVSSAAITASLGSGGGTAGSILISYFRLYGVSQAVLRDNTVRASSAASYAVLGSFDVNQVRASRATTYAVWSP